VTFTFLKLTGQQNTRLFNKKSTYFRAVYKTYNILTHQLRQLRVCHVLGSCDMAQGFGGIIWLQMKGSWYPLSLFMALCEGKGLLPLPLIPV